jgi:hypothetical protein
MNGMCKQIISVLRVVRKILSQMKTSLNKLGIAALSRLAKELKAEFRTELTLGSGIGNDPNALNHKLEFGVNVYLWDWQYGLVDSGYAKNVILGRVILSCLTAKETDSRSTTHRFSHVAVHYHNLDMLWVCRLGVDEIYAWEQTQWSEVG